MKKKFILLIFVLLLTSCDSEHLIKIDSKNILELSLENCISDENKLNWEIDDIEIENFFISELDYSVSSNCYSEEKIYYVINGFNKMSNNCIENYVMYKDVNSGEVKLVYSSKDNNTQISVIKYLKNNLFWIEENQDVWKLIKYNLNTNNIEVIDSSEITPGSYPPNIEINKDSVYWYIILDNKEIHLMYYDVLKSIKSEHSKINYYLETPYDVVNSQDNSLIYMRKNDDKIEITVENNYDNEKTTLSTNDSKIVKVIGNDKYIIWMDDWYNTNLYFYDINLKLVTKVNCDGSNIRSIALYDDLMLVDFSNVTFETSDKKLQNVSAVFQFLFDENRFVPVYVPGKNYSTAWLSVENGIFTINKWGVENDIDSFEKVILKPDSD